jgi:hypothetical protein
VFTKLRELGTAEVCGMEGQDARCFFEGGKSGWVWMICAEEMTWAGEELMQCRAVVCGKFTAMTAF